MTSRSHPLGLAEVDAALRADPARTELRYLRASLLSALGRPDEARGEYLQVIAEIPDHFGALNDLGTLLFRGGFRRAAEVAYAEAVRRHPTNPIGRINLGNLFLADARLDGAQAQYEAALLADPDHPDAHQGLANLHQDRGATEEAERHRQLSYRRRTLIHAPYRGAGEPRRVLQLVSARGGNIPTGFILDERQAAVATLVVEAGAGEGLPPHDVVFNAIGDADLCSQALALAADVLRGTTAQIVNPPGRVLTTGRLEIAGRLQGLPGVRPPRVVGVSRSRVAAEAEAFGFPLLVRSLGYHTGRHFERVAEPRQLPAALAALPGDPLLLIEPLEARGPDGLYRKYRVMMIGGRLYPLHLAISQTWKVHYFTSDMCGRPDLRAEEAAFLEDMPKALGRTAIEGLSAIQEALGLDYAGVDFGLSDRGEVLVFEANPAMVINPPPAEAIWDYRRRPILAAVSAAQALVAVGGRPNRSAAASQA